MTNERTIYFDMDGTIADFYGVENWLDYLINEDVTPYKVAKVRMNMQVLARRLNKLQKQGYHIGIISWLSKSGSIDYNERVTEVKKNWLNEHLHSVNFDKVIIVDYGTPKQTFSNGSDILFDDEMPNRKNWLGSAYDVDDILEALKNF